MPILCYGRHERLSLCTVSCTVSLTQADPLQRILRVPPKSSFERLLLETPLWQYAMSSNLKSPSEGLKNAECEKGTPLVRPPIPYVPPTDLHEKREMEQIKEQSSRCPPTALGTTRNILSTSSPFCNWSSRREQLPKSRKPLQR